MPWSEVSSCVDDSKVCALLQWEGAQPLVSRIEFEPDEDSYSLILAIGDSTVIRYSMVDRFWELMSIAQAKWGSSKVLKPVSRFFGEGSIRQVSERESLY